MTSPEHIHGRLPSRHGHFGRLASCWTHQVMHPVAARSRCAGCLTLVPLMPPSAGPSAASLGGPIIT
eukprot:scaffold272930_cov14-Tisochrysis_lutea.AAC.1